jgi:hypothetical protein
VLAEFGLPAYRRPVLWKPWVSWPEWTPRSSSSTIWRPRTVSAIIRGWKSRSPLSCHPSVTAHAIVRRDRLSAVSLSCVPRLRVCALLRGLAIRVLLRSQGPGPPGRLMGWGHAGTVLPTSGFAPLAPAPPGIGLPIDSPPPRAGPMDEQGPEVAMPALCHPQEGRRPARGILPGDEATPSGELAPILAVSRIPARRDQRRRGQGTHAGQLP